VDATSNPVIAGTELNVNNIISNYADAGFLLYREGSDEIINAQYNYWGNCHQNLGVVIPLTEFDVSNCLEIPLLTVNRNEPSNLPKYYKLSQNYPNPFNQTTTIEFALPHSTFVTLKIYHILGEKITTLVSQVLTAGKYEYNWDVGDLPVGYISTESLPVILLRPEN
jgi:hypothetical protein